MTAQGLPAKAGAAPLSTLERTGFVRTLGGVDVYLALRARIPGMSRAELDRTVERGEAQVVPAVRGCIYLVPKRDAAAALRVADVLSRGRAEREQRKAGIRSGEVERVGKEVLAVLGVRGPLTTDALRKALPAGVVRSLGEPGKKVGISSALPPALRLLEFEGKIERTLEGGRLDTERYLWRAAAKNPFDGARLPADPIELYARLAEVFFRTAGVGTMKGFANWAGISQRDATAAIERVELLCVEIEGLEEPRYAPEEFRNQLQAAEDAPEALAFLPFEDNLVALHGGPQLLVDAAHHRIQVPSWGSAKKTTLRDARHMSCRSILAEGRIAGLWEYDPGETRVVCACFDGLKPAVRKRLEAAAADLSGFLSRELGHAKSFTLDTDEDLRKRAAMIRKLVS